MNMKTAWTALAMMIACVAWADLQPPVPTPSKQSGPPHKTTENKRHESDSDQRGTDERPLAVRIVGTPVVEVHGGPKTEKESPQATNKEKDRASLDQLYWGQTADFWTATFTGGLFFVGILTAIVFICQSILLRRQIGEMVKATAATEKAANAATQSAQAAMGTALPNLWLYKMGFDDMGNANLRAKLQSPKIAVSIKNYGGSPAFVTQQGVGIYWGHILPKEPDYSEHAFDVNQETVVEKDAIFNFDPVRPRKLIPDEDVDAIQQQRKSLWVYGRVQYLDFLGKRHARAFCKQFVMGGLNPNAYVFIDCDQNPAYTESY
jgi:hypothetical protein